MSLISSLLTIFHKMRRYYWRIFEPTIVGVRALIIQNNQVMLVRHTYLDGWYLPGGKVDRGETAIRAVYREVAEECALKVKRARLQGIYSNLEQNRNDHIVLFFIDEVEVGETSRWQQLEIAESRFFALEDLPPNISPSTQRRIKEFQEQNFDNEYW